MIRPSLAILALLLASLSFSPASATSSDDCGSGRDAGADAATGVHITLPLRCDAGFLGGKNDTDVYLVNLTAGESISIHAYYGLIVYAPDGSNYGGYQAERFTANQTGTWALVAKSLLTTTSLEAYAFYVNTEFIEKRGSIPLQLAGDAPFSESPLGVSAFLGPNSPAIDGEWIQLPAVSLGHEIVSSRNYTNGEQIDPWGFYFYDSEGRLQAKCADVVCSVPTGSAYIYVHPREAFIPKVGYEYLLMYFY